MVSAGLSEASWRFQNDAPLAGRRQNCLRWNSSPLSLSGSGTTTWKTAKQRFGSVVLLNVLGCRLTYWGQAETNAWEWFNKSLRPRKPEGSLGRTAQDVHLDSHTAPELCQTKNSAREIYVSLLLPAKLPAAFYKTFYPRSQLTFKWGRVDRIASQGEIWNELSQFEKPNKSESKMAASVPRKNLITQAVRTNAILIGQYMCTCSVQALFFKL